MDDKRIFIWTKYEENAEAHRTGHQEIHLVANYPQEYLDKYIYFFADIDGNPPFEPRSNATPDSPWMLEHKGEYLKTVAHIWYCEDDVCGCYNAEAYDVFTNKKLPNARVHKGIWEGVFTTDHDSRETEDSLIRYYQELRTSDPELWNKIEWQDGVEYNRQIDPSPEAQEEFTSLYKWLYTQPWGVVGGPLHIVTDDMNLENSHLGFCMTEIDRTEYAGSSPQTDADKVKCRRMLELLRSMNLSQRNAAIETASRVTRL